MRGARQRRQPNGALDRRGISTTKEVLVKGFLLCMFVSSIVVAAGACMEEERAVSSESSALSASDAWAGLTYGGAGQVQYRGGGSVKTCFAGPMGVFLPNRFAHCYCDQLVKDCGQDATCTTCTGSRREDCANTRWFSSVSFLAGSCNVSELDQCERFCQQSCTSSCAAP